MSKKILIVEDEEDILELLSVAFEDLGDYEIICARDGEEALRIAKTNNPCIILLDVALPKLNGYEVCRSVKSDPGMSHTKVLMLSGMAQAWHRHGAGAHDAYKDGKKTLLHWLQITRGIQSQTTTILNNY